MTKKKTINKKKAVVSKTKKTTAKKTVAKKKAPAKKKLAAKKTTHSNTKAAVKKRTVTKTGKPTTTKKAPAKNNVTGKKKATTAKKPVVKKPIAKKKTPAIKKAVAKKNAVKVPVNKKKAVPLAKPAKVIAKKDITIKKEAVSKKKIEKPKKKETKSTVVAKKSAPVLKTEPMPKDLVIKGLLKRGRPKKEVIQMPSAPAKTKEEVKEELKKITLKTNPDIKSGSIDPRKIKVKRPVLPVPKIIPIRKKPQPVVATEAPKGTRYSDSDLAEFKAVIIKKLVDAKKELLEFQTQMSHVNEHGTDDTASTFKVMEDGSETLAKEEAGQLASRQRKFITQLENALIRIENKTYGVCRITGNLIRKERLLAVPHTTQSIEAKLNQK